MVEGVPIPYRRKAVLLGRILHRDVGARRGRTLPLAIGLCGCR